jgi:hypothetical protein
LSDVKSLTVVTKSHPKTRVTIVDIAIASSGLPLAIMTLGPLAPRKTELLDEALISCLSRYKGAGNDLLEDAVPLWDSTYGQ